jgi:hypothetical protein
MKISRHAVSVSLAVVGLVVSGSVFAMPEFVKQVPMSSVEQCVMQIGEQANYEKAGHVRHDVDWEERRAGGHTMTIKTIVFGADGIEVIREYATLCAVSNNSETKKFKIREKSIS